MRLVVSTFGLAALLLLASPLPAAAGPCTPAPDGALVCGEGDTAMRVLSDTMSPSQRFAIAWREREKSGSPEPDFNNVENVLVRLSDGLVLATLGGNHWETGALRANRRDEIAVWSKDSRFLVGSQTIAGTPSRCGRWRSTASE